MSAFGLVSLVIAVVLGMWWLSQSFVGSTVDQTDPSVTYSEALEAARSIPGASQP